MLSKNKRFISLVLLAVVIGLVSFADSALAGKDDSSTELNKNIARQNALGQLLNPNR